MKLVGIDFSTTPRACGICVLEGGAITHVGRGNNAAEHPDWLVGHCAEATVVAVDVPFGWPRPFMEALSCYRIGDALDLPREQYRLRATDFWIKENIPPLQPLSVSTDKLGSTAIVGTKLLHAVGNEGFRLSPRSAARSATVVEVYPAASLRAWGLPHNNIETPIVLEALREAFELTIGDTDQNNLLQSRHCLDALVSALTAKEYADGNTFYPPEYIPDETIEVEGWIHVPSRSLQ
ncbi:MAG: DUF429 domain-containing protein [Actinomycetota bacterium]|nr:DUF429 domain-containing protein [Actinomycetota bacterium]